MIKKSLIICFVFLLSLNLKAENQENKIKSSPKTITKQIQWTKQKIKDSQNGILELNKKYNNLIQKAKEEISKEQNTLAKLQENKTKMSNDRINNILSELTENLDLEKKKIEILQNSLDILTSQINNFNQKQTKQNEIISALKKRITQNENNLTDINSLNLKKTLASLNNKLDILEVRLDDIKTQSYKNKMSSKSLQTDIVFLTSEISKLKTSISKKILYSNKDDKNKSENIDKDKYIYICPNGHIAKKGQKYCTICGEKVTRKKIEKKTDNPFIENNIEDKALINILLKKAETAFNLKDYSSALKEYSNVLQYDKNNLIANFNAGVCSYLLENYVDAKKYFLKTRNISPKDESVLLYLATTYYKLEDEANAVKIWQEIIKINPDNDVAKNNLKALENK